MIKINPRIKEKAKDFVINNYAIYKNRTGLEDKWRTWDKIYNLIPDQKFYKGVANLNPPETRKACDSLVDFVDEIIFGSDPMFRLEGIGGDNDDKKADINKDIINIQIEKARIRAKMRGYVKNTVKYGFGIVKVPFVYKDKYIIQKEKERSKLNKIFKKILNTINPESLEKPIEKKEVAIYDNIDFQVQDPFNLFWNYYLPWEDQTCIIERILNVSETHLKLQEKKGVYHGVTEILKKDRPGSSSPYDEGRITRKYPHYSELTGLSDNFDTSKKTHELLEAWCNFDIDNDGLDEECVITILDGEHIIRLETNPYDIQEKPFLFCPWNELESTSLGVGVPQLCERSQIALNDFQNQVMDNITAILNTMKIVDAASEIPDEQLKSRPNGIIRSQIPIADAVKELEMKKTASEGMQAMAIVKEDIRQVSGATLSMQGMPAKYDTTATEVASQANASSRGLISKVRDIEDLIIKPMLRKIYSYNMQFMSKNDLIKLLGEKAAAANFEQYLGEDNTVSDILLQDYNFIPMGATQVENKIVKRQQLLNFLNISNSLEPGIINKKKLVKLIWDNMGIRGEDILFPDIEDTLVSANDENIIMEQGEKAYVNVNDNHQHHIVVHEELLNSFPYLAQIIGQHLQEHYTIFAQSQEQSQQQSPNGRGGIAPQEQPNFAPEEVTPANSSQVPGLVSPPGGL